MAKTNQEMNILGEASFGKPYKSYIKKILGKVYVMVLDQFSNQPVGILLTGDPRKKDEGCIVDVFSEIEDVYFRRTNKRHFETGDIIPYARVEEVREKTVEQFDDAELLGVVNQKFIALQHSLNKITSEAVLFRMLALAQDNEKSDKIVGAIKARVSEVQMIKPQAPEE
jgi:hypothetical protein